MLPVLWFLTYIVDVVADYMKVCGIEEVEMRRNLFLIPLNLRASLSSQLV